ncbi:MAG: bifunctional aldolase/short-chain dehydrogenase [Thermoleophilaceae bacterium]
MSAVAPRAENRWDPKRARGLDALGQLAYRSNLLGADRSVANYGGGNTSAKRRERDHTGREIEVLWVKPSGSDLADIEADEFTGLRLDEILPLLRRAQMSDAEMVAYLARCQLDPAMARASIETLLHAFTPAPHVDHTHPDAIGMICCSADGERLAADCFGAQAIWIPYLRPGFALSKQVGEAVRNRPGARLVLLAKHGLVTWGDTPEGCYAATIDVINRAAEFVSERAAGARPLAPAPSTGISEGGARELLATALPALRGHLSENRPKILRVDRSEAALELVKAAAAEALTRIGAACPDHLVHTKVRPLWVRLDAGRDPATQLEARLREGVDAYRRDYEAYFERNRHHGETIDDPDPRVVLIEELGVVVAGRDLKAATLARDLYRRAIAVMRGAAALDEFVSLTEEESYAVEYWPLERYKLTLAPPPRELAGRVALVTGAAGGIGRAIVDALAAEGACVVAADIDGEGASEVATELDGRGLAVEVDVTDEAAVAAAFEAATLAYGGVDIVVSNAGLASSAPIERTDVELWDRDQAVLAKGYFLVAREAFRLMTRQGRGGSIVFVGSKNALAPGRGAVAYSSAKAAELHLARCLAEEGGERGIRVNTVNPDAVLRGSRIWDSDWRTARAGSHGIAPDALEAYYRERTALKVNIHPEDVAAAVLHFASSERSAKSTGNLLNVDGGIATAYPR